MAEKPALVRPAVHLALVAPGSDLASVRSRSRIRASGVECLSAKRYARSGFRSVAPAKADETIRLGRGAFAARSCAYSVVSPTESGAWGSPFGQVFRSPWTLS